MDKKSILKELVSLAEGLDEKCLYKEADDVTAIIHKIANVDIYDDMDIKKEMGPLDDDITDTVHVCDECGEEYSDDEMYDASECDTCYHKRMQAARREWESLGKPEPTRENLEYSNALDSNRLKESI